MFFFLMIRRPPRSTQGVSSAASDVYKRQYQRRVHGTLVMAISNYPFAILTIVALSLYLYISNEMRRNGWLHNIVLVTFPLLIFVQLNFTFYTWNSFLPMIRYMIIEYMTTGGGMYVFFLFNFCPFCQDTYRILSQSLIPVSYTHLRAHETSLHLVCRLLLEKKKKKHTLQYNSHCLHCLRLYTNL
eukprot:TRINITY_DN4631_c0_g1_i1.p1 TRINITY_DN4631_c0_g1~~TRINITY_DN4631_c0_g1_i1.p1  ORF type:complete len:186 (+),score=30.30 TRINITY_DN4631_c0_g1_i1:66-623(+)